MFGFEKTPLGSYNITADMHGPINKATTLPDFS